jgi:hypothetical protein
LLNECELVLTCVYSDLNRLIMDYLVIEGYTSAAEEFSKEAEVKDTMNVDFGLIESRMNIKRAVHRGDIKEAIEKVNDLNPEVGEKSFHLFYSSEDYSFHAPLREPSASADTSTKLQSSI